MTARDAGFAAVLRDLLAAVGLWQMDAGAAHWVGVPGMSALARALALVLQARQQEQVTSAQGRGAMVGAPLALKQIAQVGENLDVAWIMAEAAGSVSMGMTSLLSTKPATSSALPTEHRNIDHVFLC